MTPRLDAHAAEYFGPDVPSIRELEQRTALAFVNTNPVMDYVAPLPENVIPVAGVHIKEPKPLPQVAESLFDYDRYRIISQRNPFQNLKTFLATSKRGVVVLCLGSHFRSEYIPKVKQNMFLEVFKELTDYHFLWKFESNFTASDLPNNVRIEPWLPLSDILADSNVKAIFFHGGLLTTQEALWRGVPMIIMPFGLDQRQVSTF